MPRYLCEYCDAYLTHDSPSVRKQHNTGYKHKANVRNYYMQFEEAHSAASALGKMSAYDAARAGVLLGAIPHLGAHGVSPGWIPMPGGGMMPMPMPPPGYRPPMGGPWPGAPPPGVGPPRPPYPGMPPPGWPGGPPGLPPPNQLGPPGGGGNRAYGGPPPAGAPESVISSPWFRVRDFESVISSH